MADDAQELNRKTERGVQIASDTLLKIEDVVHAAMNQMIAEGLNPEVRAAHLMNMAANGAALMLARVAKDPGFGVEFIAASATTWLQQVIQNTCTYADIKANVVVNMPPVETIRTRMQ